MKGLYEQTLNYSALVKSIDMSDYGYWRVTFSAAPGVDSSVLVCENGIDRATALSLAVASYSHVSGQKVTL
jgi:hypothetical protein